MTPEQQRAKQVKAALGTTGVCVVVFLLMLLTSAWKTAGQGEGEYTGIEVNLGYDEQGSGNDQPDRPIGEPNATDTENPPAEETKEPVAENTAPAPTPTQQDVKPVEPTTLTDPNSDVAIKDVKKEVKPVEKTVAKNVEEKPVEKPPVEKPKVVDKAAVYQPKTSGQNTTSGDGKGRQGTTGGEGDDDKGVAGGTPGANVYTGTPGGGNGGTLDLKGWAWAEQPNPKLPPNESGIVRFQITVNEDGEITKLVPLERGVSLEAVQIIRQAIERAALRRTSGERAPAESSGVVTFIVRSQ
jgi:hypothetical protein